jgi:class 3 adenylate cyclase
LPILISANVRRRIGRLQQILVQVVVQDNLAAPAGKLDLRQLPTPKRLFDVRQANGRDLGGFGL